MSDSVDFEAIDVWHGNGSPVLRSHASHVVFVRKQKYDLDLLPGQEAVADAYAQLNRDIRRSRFFMNGHLTTRIRSDLPVSLWRYCTQSVMALPAEFLLHSFAAVIAERQTNSPMRIDASSHAVVVTKKLDVRMEDERRIPVTITICARVDDPNVVVVFDFV